MAYGIVDFKEESEVDKLKKDMGLLIKLARISMNIRQFDIVMKLGIRQARISDIENGKVEITVSELIKLSRILEKPIIDLFPAWSISKDDEKPISSELEMLVHHASKLPAQKINEFTEQIKSVVKITKSRNFNSLLES